MCALIIHHSCHGGHNHQRCHYKEEDREDLGDSVYNSGIVFKAHISDVGISAQKVGIRMFDILNFVPCIVQFFLRIGDFLFTVGDFFFAVSDFLPAFSKFRFCIFYFLPAVCNFLLACFYLNAVLFQF